MKLTETDRIRLLAECNAVLSWDQLVSIASSMDLAYDDLDLMLGGNEREWEKLKDETDRLD